MTRGTLAFVLTDLCLFLTRAGAVVFFATGDPHYNTTAPTEPLANSGWELQGDTFSGTPVAPGFFITATHLGGQAGDTFAFRGVVYPMVEAFAHPYADITLWRINGTFPQYAPLYTSQDEIGKPLLVFGRGCQRGEEVQLHGVLKGWTWGPTDGLLRWGENVVAGISDAEGHDATSATAFQLLRADFDADAGPNEAQLSGGDSGGGVFIRDGDVWKLAGVSHAANKDYSLTSDEPGFNATLFDEAGFFEGELGKREYRPEDPAMPKPGSFYATRISAYVNWIQNIISATNSIAALTLEEATTILGPYTPVAGARVDTALKTITISNPAQTRFYRIIGDRPYILRTMSHIDQRVEFSYE